MPWNFFPIAQFDRHAEAWDRVNRSGPHHVLLESRFMAPLLREFFSGTGQLALHSDGDGFDAAAVVVRAKPGVWSTFQPSQAPLGAFVQSGDADREALAQSLLRALPGLGLMLGITQQDPAVTPRPAQSPRISTLDYIQTARITLDCDFDTYWASRGKNLRHNMKRQRNRLEREGVAVKLVELSAPGDMAGAIDAYGALESEGWKAEGGTAIHKDNAQGRFYRAMLESYAATGQARVYQFYYDGKLVSTDLCIFNEAAFVILKTTYDESQNTSSPALLMRREAFPAIFDQKLSARIEFYGKVMDWHTKWSEEIRILYHENHYRWRLLNRLHA